MKIFSPHISFTELADLADEHAAASAEALGHLAECSSCSAQLETIRQTTSLMKSNSIESAPAELVKYAKNIFRQRVARPEPRALSRIVAALTFDSFTAAPAYGLRSQAGDGRQCVFSTETVDIEVRVSEENEELQVAGQIPGLLCTGGEVNLEGEKFSAKAKLNELCEFAFSSVPKGTYTLAIHLPDVIIETPPLELGP